MTEQLKITRFDMKNIPQVMEVVLPLWGPPDADEKFRKLDVEFIVRNNIYDLELSMQLTDESRQECDKLLSAAFATRKTDRNNAREWLAEHSKNVSVSERISLSMVIEYLEYMDRKTLSFMNDDDIKLSLFVSRKKGAGSALLKQMTEKLKGIGYRNMYLWTDVDCNWQWYTKNGYTYVSEETYVPFSDEYRDYKTFIFKKAL